MKQIILSLSLILSYNLVITAQLYHPDSGQKYSIEEPSNDWILELIDSLRYKTSLCETCLSPPTFKRYEDRDGQVLYRLRYSCNENTSYVRIFNTTGEVVATCHIDVGIKDCNDFEAYTDFTFTKSLLNVWSCKNGFNCPAKDSLGLFREYSFIVGGSECEDKIRELSISSPFNEYMWKGADGNISYKSNIMADQSGMYSIEVADHDGCLNSKQEEIHVFKERSIPVEGDKVICTDEVTYLKSNGYSSYEWSTGETADHIVVDEGGPITLKVTDELGCSDSTTVEIKKITGRSVDIAAGDELFYRDQVIPITLELHGMEFGDIKDISWGSEGELTCDDCPSPFGKFSDDSEIFVLVTDVHDCGYDASIDVEPEFAYKDVYASNVFTPNGDGENDTFYIRSRTGAAIIHTFKVFNRWGVPIHEVGRHEVNDESKAWDGTQNGTLLPVGVYVYMAEVEFIDGSKKYITGDILLAH